MPHAIQGVLPVFQTPFHDDESVDYDTLAAEIDWLFDMGADGVVSGMVSETLRLDGVERRMLAECVCEAARDRGPVVISAGAESTINAIVFARHAEEAGASGVMVIPPVSIKLDEDELRRYYSRIIESVDIPVIVQDASGYVGRPMSIALQAGLFNAYGPRVMFKPEAEPIGPRLTELHAATGGGATVFEGSGGVALVDSFKRGVAGTMPGADLIDGIVALWRALSAGDAGQIAILDAALQRIVACQRSLDAFLAVEKHLLVRRGVFKNALVRGPVGWHLDEVTRAEIDNAFDAMQQALRTNA
jgi:dihydrodipicolinate synthase/N-acetylneuraminate lyase